MAREVRVCDNCGTSNSIDRLECEQCGYDLSFTVPTIENEGNEGGKKKIWRITSNSGIASAEIGAEELVGREGTILSDYVNSSDYISRKHARLNIIDGKLYVVDYSTNGTTLNGVKIPQNESVEVSEGDELAFADMAFRVTSEYAD